jgi:predicted RNA-binding Zn-ribbon protein involved in translation (DUF1610 family)
MEERHDSFVCPNCGREMRKGITHGAQRPPLIWYPGRNRPTQRELFKMPTAEKTEDLSGGVRFDSVQDWFLETYRPAWYCPECDLLLIDTKTKLGRA